MLLNFLGVMIPLGISRGLDSLSQKYVHVYVYLQVHRQTQDLFVSPIHPSAGLIENSDVPGNMSNEVQCLNSGD